MSDKIGVIKELAELLRRPLSYIVTRPNRFRLWGARVEVIAFILCRSPEPSVLLGRSAYHNMWMPPQEGVNLHESFQEALFRCLQTECGLELPKEEKEISRQLHLRSILYVGATALPPERVGERPVADDAVGTWLEQVTLKRKAYWKATMILADRGDISPKPDGRELLEFRWFTIPEARLIVSETNHADKAGLLLKCFDQCELDLKGAPRKI